jgi:transposase
MLTVVADHDRAGAVVWAKEGKDADTLKAFYDELGEARCAQLHAVSMDMGEAYRAFVTLSATVRVNRERILAAIELGLSNSKLEGLNSKIRLINHRGYGHHSAAALIAMIYLCCGGVTVELPLK